MKESAWSQTQMLLVALRFLIRAARNEAMGLVIGVLFRGFTPVATAWLAKLLVDSLMRDNLRKDEVLQVVAIMGLVGLVTAIFSQVIRYLNAEMDRKLSFRGQQELAIAMGRMQGLRRLEEPDFHDRLQIAGHAGRAGPGQVFAGLLGVFQAVVSMASFFVVLLFLDWRLVLVVFVASVPGVVNNLRQSRRRFELVQRTASRERREFFYSGLLTKLSVAKEVRLFGLSAFFVGRMESELSSIHAEHRSYDRRVAWSQGVLAAFGALSVTACTAWAVTQCVNHHLSIGDLLIVMAAVPGVISGAVNVSDHLAGASFGLTSYRQFVDVVSVQSDLSKAVNPKPIKGLECEIKFKNVWFRYSEDGPWILKGVSFSVLVGRATALVGVNGAGKSTIVKLLCRFYDPQVGEIHWDGQDLRDVDIEELRSRIGAVFQDFVDYELSVAENIGLGDIGNLGSRSEIVAAAKTAGIDSVLAGLPRGYDTMLTRSFVDSDDGSSGVLLSGGQWQRLALARALFRKDRDLLILDEPSAGLDPFAEAELSRCIRAHRATTTSVLISHRMNTVRDADHIVVLDGGVVAESGTHDELVEKNGIYRRMFEMQARGYQSDVPVDA